MKIMVCVDGSEHSYKAVRKASELTENCNVDELTLIHVYHENISDIIQEDSGEEIINIIKKETENQKKEAEKVLEEAAKIFEDKNIEARTLLKRGRNPARTIIATAKEEEVDMIVIGNRGLGRLNRLYLGSVSNTVIQEIEGISVLTVK